MSTYFDNNVPKNLDQKAIREVDSVIPKKRQDLLKWSGWGYKDSKFYSINDEIFFSGTRYPVGGDVQLPNFGSWVRSNFNTYMSDLHEQPQRPLEFPDSFLNDDFVERVKKAKIEFSIEGEDRLIRCHGQTVHEIYHLRKGEFKRIPDIVLWPRNHEDVITIVDLANEKEVVLIPFGGGTSVSGAVTCPQNETRSIAIVDTSQMNRLLWFDRENLVACFESGIVGQDLERVLQEENLTMGHEPDSAEFSTLGGWVATRASGMKKNVYGNIEDIVVRVKMVTCKGVLERNISAPRVSCGPDFNQIIIGSEGMFGIITEVVVKIRPLPKVKKYGSLVFPDIDTGIRCLREIAKRRYQPASIRLMDNEQFHFGQALKLPASFFANFIDGLKKFLLTKLKGYDLKKIAVATLLFEGDKDEVEKQEKLIYEIAAQHSGINSGETNGQKGYVLTFVIAYIRDLALDFGIIAESFETSVPWNKCESLCRNVKSTIRNECKKNGIEYYLISCRVTQTYDAGACVYFYFGFRWNPDCKDPVALYESIENNARDEVLASGGSISHHHGIGKIRTQWYKQSVSQIGVNLYKSVKIELDPKNIFALDNILPSDEKIDFEKLKSKL